MTWYLDMLEWLSAPTCPYCGGEMEPVGIQDRAGRCTECGRIHLEGAHGDYIDDYLRTHRPAWWGDAVAEEILTFALSSVNPPDGSGIAGLDNRELRRQMAVVTSRLRAPATRTRWLESYTDRLIAEAVARNSDVAS